MPCLLLVQLDNVSIITPLVSLLLFLIMVRGNPTLGMTVNIVLALRLHALYGRSRIGM